ncbi:hypothetical protein [Paenibacillus sinopodophylli]|uniref:hypothetical protein n=1 Tax=Paenibacillus sinopodophylli TaxID=1837342 RepID=UPI00110CD01D|nr:hypothetical protein [Paenibacillus sinopodophylli]
MRNEFLYEKPMPVGYINDTVEDIHTWFSENPLKFLQAKFRNSSLIDMVNEVVTIFEEGNPNFKIVYSLFGRGLINEVGEFITIYKLETLENSVHKLIDMKMYVNNTSLIIEKLHLYFDSSDLTPTLTLKMEEDKAFLKKGVYWEKSIGRSVVCISAI